MGMGNKTLLACKKEIQEKELIWIQEQELIFNNIQLQNEKDLNFYFKIGQPATIHLVRKNKGKLTIFEDDLLDPRYDYDFTNIKDQGHEFRRGGQIYNRPCGWKRIALKVNGKYESDVWLGSTNSENEWPVAYHGTNFDGFRGICLDGFDLKKLKRSLSGKGHYTTPLIDIADSFATFTKFNGVKIKYIIQIEDAY